MREKEKILSRSFPLFKHFRRGLEKSYPLYLFIINDTQSILMN